MNTIQKIQAEVEAKRTALNSLLGVPAAERGEDYASKRDALTSELKGLNSDFEAAKLADLPEAKTQELSAQREKAVNILDVANASQKVNSNNRGIDLKSIREAGRGSAQVFLKDFDVADLIRGTKSTVTRTTMGQGVSYDELNLKPVRPVSILDFIPSAMTDQSAINYRRGTVTASASARAEGQTLSELTVSASQVSDPIQAIGVILHASAEEVQDDGQFSLVLQAMLDDVRREVEENATVGSGTAPALRGITTTASVQTEAYTTSKLVSCLSAKSTLRTTERATPGLFAFLPSDWTLIMAEMLATPGYVVQYIQDGLIPVLHGLPVVEQEDLTSGAGLVMDPSLYALLYKQGLVMESTNSNGTMFNDLTESFRAYVRCALKTRRLGARLIDLTS